MLVYQRVSSVVLGYAHPCRLGVERRSFFVLQCLQVFAKLKVVDDCRSFINVVRPMINRPQFHLQTLHYWMFIAVAVPYNHITTCSQLHLLVRSLPEPPKKTTTHTVVGPAFGAGVCRSLATGGRFQWEADRSKKL